MVNMLIKNFIPAILVSIITAMVTVRLSIKQYQSQRWWEKKAETYNLIIKNLAELRYFIEDLLKQHEGEKVIINQDKYNEINHAILKVTYEGNYIISDEAFKLLTHFRSEFKGLVKEIHENEERGVSDKSLCTVDYDLYTEITNDQIWLIKDTIKEFIKAAKRDLFNDGVLRKILKSVNLRKNEKNRV